MLQCRGVIDRIYWTNQFLIRKNKLFENFFPTSEKFCLQNSNWFFKDLIKIYEVFNVPGYRGKVCKWKVSKDNYLIPRLWLQRQGGSTNILIKSRLWLQIQGGSPNILLKSRLRLQIQGGPPNFLLKARLRLQIQGVSPNIHH